MAVDTIIAAQKVRISYLGEVKDGKQTFINKTYSNVKPEAEDEDIYDVSEILAGFQTKDVHSTVKISDVELIGL